MGTEERIVVGALFVAIGLAALIPEIRRARQRRRGRYYMRLFRERMIGDFNNLVSQAMLSARPEVPPSWAEMVAVETAAPPCDCPVCTAERAAMRRGLN